MIFASALAGFTTAPPYTPECRSTDGPCTRTSMYASPRRPMVMDGSPGANMVVSEIITASQRSRSALAARNSARCGDPTSSSPSTQKTTFTGSEPLAARWASTALRWRYTCPLSSTEPRA